MLEKEAARRPSASEVEQILAKLAAGLCEPTSVTVAPSSPGHTVGREKEHAELRDAFAAAATGQGMMVCVAGEPGIGKTTLVEDFLNEERGPCVIAREVPREAAKKGTSYRALSAPPRPLAPHLRKGLQKISFRANWIERGPPIW